MMRIAILTVLLMSVVGCVGGGGGAVPVSALESRPYGSDNGRGSSFRLKEDLTLNGQLVPKGSYVCGLRANDDGWEIKDWDKVEWLIRPEFERLIGYKNIVFGKRFGASTWVRFDMTGKKPKEEPTPYTDITRIAYNMTSGSGYHEFDRWAGRYGNRVVLFDKDGKPGVIFDDVSGFSSVNLLREEGALLVRFISGYDRVYAATGRPISPELPTLWFAYVMISPWGQSPEAESVAFGVPTDAAKGRYWLLQDNGRVLPKPDDCLGMQPMIGKNYLGSQFWDGWLVWWKTPEGDRCARVDRKEATTNLAAIMASRERAEFEELVTNYNDRFNSFAYIVRRGGQSRYEIIERDVTLPQRFESVAAAEKYLYDTRKAEAEAYSKAVREHDKWKAQRDAEERRAQADAAAKRRQAEDEAKRQAAAAAQSAFDKAMLGGNQSSAREQLLKLQVDANRWTKYISKYGLDPAKENGSQSIGYARAKAGGTDATVLEAALKKSQAAAAPKQPTGPNYAGMSDWEYFWNGPPSSRVGGGSNPMNSLDAYGKHLDATRQQNMDAWMRGAQNWGGPR